MATTFPVQDNKSDEKQQLELFKQKINDHVAHELKTKDEFICTYLAQLYTPFTDFKAKHLNVILMCLAKPDFLEEFGEVLRGYLDFCKSEQLSSLETLASSSPEASSEASSEESSEQYYEELMNRDAESASVAIKKLIAFIEQNKTNDEFISICGKFLLNFAARYCIPDICEYLINECHISLSGIQFREISRRLNSSTLLHNLRDSYRCCLEDVQDTYKCLLGSCGVNFFIFEEESKELQDLRVRGPRSCLRPTPNNMMASLDSNGFFPLLELGAGLLKKDCRFLIPGENSSQLAFHPNIAIYDIAGIDGYLSFMCNQLHRAKIIDSDPAEFFKKLLDSEIVFCVSDERRFIFSTREFIEYINNIEHLSPNQCAIIRNIYKLIKMLSEEEASRLAPGIKDGLENLFTERKNKVEILTQFLSQVGFRGNSRAGLLSIPLSYLDLPDPDVGIDASQQSRVTSLGNAPRTKQ